MDDDKPHIYDYYDADLIAEILIRQTRRVNALLDNTFVFTLSAIQETPVDQTGSTTEVPVPVWEFLMICPKFSFLTCLTASMRAE